MSKADDHPDGQFETERFGSSGSYEQRYLIQLEL